MLRTGQGALRSTDPAARLRLIYSTAATRHTHNCGLPRAVSLIAAKKAGVINYIVKPFSAATLKITMEVVFGGLSDAATVLLRSGIFIHG